MKKYTLCLEGRNAYKKADPEKVKSTTTKILVFSTREQSDLRGLKSGHLR